MARPTRLTQEMIDEYVARGYWDDVSLVDILRRNAVTYPDREASVDSKHRLTWSELNKRTDMLARGLLRTGMVRDQTVVCQIPNSVTAVEILLACLKAGIVSCFCPMTFRERELRHVMETLKTKAFVTPGMYRGVDYLGIVEGIASSLPLLENVITLTPDPKRGKYCLEDLIDASSQERNGDVLLCRPFGPFEVSIVVLSSGTTGMPKCIEHTQSSCKVAGRGIIKRGNLTPEDVFGIIAPFSGGPGLQNLWAAILLGAKICLIEHFSPEHVLELIEKERVTYLAAIPSQIVRILRECNLENYDLSSLRIIRTGAAAFDASVAREVEEKIGCMVLIAGGSQETYSFAQTGVDDPPEKRLSTLGKTFPGNELKIVDDDGEEVRPGEVGNLMVRGAATSSGYFGDPEMTRAAWGCLGKDGWYCTGDLARLDEEGYLVLVGRKKEIIIRAGQNIYPREIEDLLITHPKIREAVVIGIPDPVMGERACACVTLRKREKFDFEEMISYLRQKKLAVHKLPERLVIMERFPLLADGQKIDRKAISKWVIENAKKTS